MPIRFETRIPGLRYCGITLDRTIHFEKVNRRFRVIVYTAADSHSLISTSDNGIAVLDVDNLKVYLDTHQRETGHSTFPGHSQVQYEEFIRITTMTWPMFLEFVNDHPCARFFMDEDGAIRRERRQPW